MENSSGEDLSSTASHSFSGDGGSAAASEESGWTSYIDYFMETQQQQRRHNKEEVSRRAGDPSTDDVAGAGRRCSSASECSSDTGVGATTWLPSPLVVEPSTVVSRRLSLREGWRRRKKVMYDESLEDTATSPISRPKLIELTDSDGTHHQKKRNSCDEISRSKRKISTGSDVNNGANTTIITAIKEDSAYDNNNELMMRKKGQLVPISAFPRIADANKFIGC